MIIELSLVVLVALNFSRSIAAPAIDGRPEKQNSSEPNDVREFKDIPFLNFVRNETTKGGLDELKCEGKEDLNEENELCLKYTVQVANCSNAYFQMFYHPKWECTYMDLSPKVQIDWQLVKCDTVDKYPSPLPATYIAGTCYLRYGLKLNDDARNNKEPDKSPDELENPNLQTNESSLLWLYIAGGCLAGLFFLIGVLICFQAGINEQCSKTCCDCGELESLLCMQSCCEISVCCLHGFSRSD